MKKCETSQLKNIMPYKVFFFAAPFLIGGFYPFISCVFSVLLGGYLLWLLYKNKSIKVYINDTFLAVAAFLAAYLFSTLWAVDKGMAVFGFFKFLPIAFFTLLIMQTDDDQKKQIIKTLPFSASAMVAVSFLLHFVPQLKGFFTVSGRLSGFFQYPNSFAVFLLCGFVVSTQYLNNKRISVILDAVLLFGIFESGSRITFFLTVITVVVLIAASKNKSKKLITALIFIVGITAAVVYSKVTDNYYTVGRFLTSSANSSTILGRILYYKDAVPVVLKHPFGLGYLGYYYTQQQFQTGVYSVMFVHNEFLQFLLDVGWVPTVLFVIAIFESFFAKSSDLSTKLITAIICGHSLLDFDLQFISVFFLLLMQMNVRKGKEKTVDYGKSKCVLFSLFAVASLYFGIADFTEYIKKDRLAVRIFPFNTAAEVEMLTKCDNAADAKEIADRIVLRNENISVAYSAIANYEYSRGEIENFIKNKDLAISIARYDYCEYEDYADKLIELIVHYQTDNDIESADFCFEKLFKLKEKLSDLQNETSSLAWKITDKPTLVFSDEINVFINSYQNPL